jgi:hypothetical protein
MKIGKTLIPILGCILVGAVAWAFSYGPLRYTFATPPASLEIQAITNLKTINAAELFYHQKIVKDKYATLEELSAAGLLSECLSKATCGKYRFEIREGQKGYEAVAVPERYGAYTRMSFYTTSKGKIHGADKKGEEAGGSDPIIEQ